MTVEIPIRLALAYSLGTLVSSIGVVAASGTTEVIAGLVGARASDLVALRPRPLGTQEAFLRADETAAAAAPPWPESAADERDEIDELFLGPR